MEIEPVVGLEIHAQLSTDSKIFAPSATTVGKPPNTLTDPVTLGMPGSLPVLNKRAVEFALKLGLAMNCQIQPLSVFARKHYFYPDLPKGYQISQYEQPLCLGGFVEIHLNGEPRRIGITRIHLEEDAGKNTHFDTEQLSFVDLNRAGVPLVEIVSEPDLRSAEEAGILMRQIRQIVRYLDICDGNMEEGSLRCDANVSVRRRGEKVFGTKVEIKNLNSFRFVEKAISYEIARQAIMLEKGEPIAQETRLWDEGKAVTRSMRSKEYASDYRYFPDPDLLPLVIDEGWLARVRTGLPELPQAAFERFKTMYGLDDYMSEVLTSERSYVRYYDQAVSVHNNPLAIANWISTELFGRLNRDGIAMEQCPVSPENLATLVRLIDDQVISGKIAKTVFDEMFDTGNEPENIVQQKGLKQITDRKQLEAVVTRVIEQNPKQLADYRAGKTKMLGFFVGQVMQQTEGKANPVLVNEILEAKLKG